MFKIKSRLGTQLNNIIVYLLLKTKMSLIIKKTHTHKISVATWSFPQGTRWYFLENQCEFFKM